MIKKKKELSIEEKVAIIQQKTAMYHLILGLIEMPWFRKLMEKTIEDKKEVKEAKP